MFSGDREGQQRPAEDQEEKKTKLFQKKYFIIQRTVPETRALTYSTGETDRNTIAWKIRISCSLEIGKDSRDQRRIKNEAAVVQVSKPV